MNNDTFLIEESDLELAKNICKTIKSPEKRNRAVANALAADIAGKYFSEIEADTTSGLHAIPQVLDDIEISDVYLKDSYIDVRLYFEENQLCVPKEHFDRKVLPVAYMFVKIDADLSNGTVTGFIQPESINKVNPVNGYYQVLEEELVSYYDIENLLVSNYSDDVPEDFEIQMFAYLDGKHDDVDSFYKVLLSSKYCRNQLREASNVKNIFNFVSISSDANTEAVNSEVELDLNTDLSDESSMISEFDPLEESADLSLNIDENVEIEMLDDSTDIGFESDAIEEFQPDSIEILESADSTELIPDIEDKDCNFNIETSVLDINPNIEEIPLSQDFTEDSSSSILDASFEVPATIEESEPEIITEPTSDINFDLETLTEPIEDTATDAAALEVETNELTVSEIQVAQPIEEKNEPVTENSDLDAFVTNTTPSLGSIEENIEGENSIEDLESLLDNDKSIFDEEEMASKNEKSPQIEELFGDEVEPQEKLDETFVQPVKKSSGAKIIPLLGVVAIVAALGYFGYTKFYNTEGAYVEETPETASALVKTHSELPAQTEAMPIETVENVNKNIPTNEGNAISIPAIEQNLDASILVSNLSVNWEVPAGYLSNNTAKRYFTKMGKIIQLNLKTELLLLSKPPITNKIMLELEFDKNSNKFTIKNITASSGEKTVDDLIVKTVKYALDMNMKSNMSVFANLAGNPTLIIRL